MAKGAADHKAFTEALAVLCAQYGVAAIKADETMIVEAVPEPGGKSYHYQMPALVIHWFPEQQDPKPGRN